MSACFLVTAQSSPSPGSVLRFSKHSHTFPSCLPTVVLCDVQPWASSLIRWNPPGLTYQLRQSRQSLKTFKYQHGSSPQV